MTLARMRMLSPEPSFLIKFRHKSALLDLSQDCAVDKLFRFGGFCSGIFFRHPGELGLDRGGGRMRYLRVEIAIEPIDIFERFPVIDSQIFAHGANGRLGIVFDHVDAFDDRAQVSRRGVRLGFEKGAGRDHLELRERISY